VPRSIDRSLPRIASRGRQPALLRRQLVASPLPPLVPLHELPQFKQTVKFWYAGQSQLLALTKMSSFSDHPISLSRAITRFA